MLCKEDQTPAETASCDVEVGKHGFVKGLEHLQVKEISMPI